MYIYLWKQKRKMNQNKAKTLWTVGTPDPRQQQLLESTCSLSPFVAKLLTCRGLTQAHQAQAYLQPQSLPFEDPLQMADLPAGALALNRAIEQNQYITVFGDYDVDGITATVITVLYLQSRGARVRYSIPDRTRDGYGLSQRALEEAAALGSRVAITVDCGISALEQAQWAREQGITLIVTDHHACLGPLPQAQAVIDPNRPDCPYPHKGLAGCGVAWKLLSAAEHYHTQRPIEDCQEELLHRYGDLIALGTVADMMPLAGENRRLTSFGLNKLRSRPFAPLAVLLQEAGVEPANANAGHFSFTLAPKLNAAGRMDSAALSAQLLLSQDPLEQKALSQRLDELNQRRKQEEEQIYQQAVTELARQSQEEKPSFLLAYSDTWHPGVIGIAASRISQQAHLPCLLITFAGDSPIGHGSARSIKGFHLAKALAQCADLLEAHGGHELAAGLSVKKENLPLLQQRLEELAREQITPELRQKTVACDCQLSGQELTLENAKALAMFEPYGTDNAPFLFFIGGATVLSVIPLSQGKHVKLTVEVDSTVLPALCFRMNAQRFPFQAGQRVDLACVPDVNEYQNTQRLQLIVKNIRTTTNQKE